MQTNIIEFPYPIESSKLCLALTAKIIILLNVVLSVCRGSFWEREKHANGGVSILKLVKQHQWTSISFGFLWLYCVFDALCGLSLVLVSRGYSVWGTGSLLHCLLLRTQTLGLWAQYWRCTCSVAQQHVESSWTENQTHVPALACGFLTLDHQESPDFDKLYIYIKC